MIVLTGVDILVLICLSSFAGWGVAMGICTWTEGRQVERILQLHREHCGECSLSTGDLPIAKVISEKRPADDLPDARVLKW